MRRLARMEYIKQRDIVFCRPVSVLSSFIGQISFIFCYGRVWVDIAKAAEGQ